MPEYTYMHGRESCGHGNCHNYGTRVTVRPEVKGTVHYFVPPICNESGNELELIGSDYPQDMEDDDAPTG